MNFFPLPKGDAAFLLLLLLFTLLSFGLPIQDLQLGGMDLLGWLMAALMIFSPLIALLRISKERP